MYIALWIFILLFNYIYLSWIYRQSPLTNQRSIQGLPRPVRDSLMYQKNTKRLSFWLSQCNICSIWRLGHWALPRFPPRPHRGPQAPHPSPHPFHSFLQPNSVNTPFSSLINISMFIIYFWIYRCHAVNHYELRMLYRRKRVRKYTLWTLSNSSERMTII